MQLLLKVINGFNSDSSKVDQEQALPKNKDNFRWEVHVLFDDAINCNFQTSEIVPNEFLRTFCDEMASMIASYAMTTNGHVTEVVFNINDPRFCLITKLSFTCHIFALHIWVKDVS